MHFKVTPTKIFDASVTVPGDKSVSHRALLLGSIANGRTEVSGFLAGDDCLATLASMRSLGVDIQQPSATELSIEGVGLHGLQAPAGDLDVGNSGTAMRLMAGLLSGQHFDSVLTGDDSLSARPMERIITPLTQMGASIGSCAGKPPLTIRGTDNLRAIHYELPVASAQVKSAVLLAGLYAAGTTSVTEHAVTRDHTERMLHSMGGTVTLTGGTVTLTGGTVTLTGGTVTLTGGQPLQGCELQVPSDLSSATFVMLAALLAEKADVQIKNVGVNPTRTGVIDILQAMGADISLENPQLLGAEPVADIRVRSSKLTGVRVDRALVSLAIDEFPALFVAAASANGRTEFSGLGELRVKESDRISTMAEGMRVLGIEVQETDDGAVVQGGRFCGGTVQSNGDHRVAMSLAVAGTIASDEVVVRDVESVNTSFPGFCECMAALGADIRPEQGG